MYKYFSKIKRISFGHKIGQEHKPMSKTQETIIIHVGVILLSIGIYFFKFQNNFAIGGVSGISVILNALLPNISISTVNLVLNVLLLILGFIFFGKKFGLRTAYCSMLSSLLIEFFSYAFPMAHPLTNQPFLELIYAVILPGIGAGLLFNIRASSGGTEIIAMIVKKYSSMNIGKALLVSDIIVTCMTLFIFDTQTALFSILGLLTKSMLVDMTIESINKVKYFIIVTDKPDEVIEFIVTKLHRGGTKLDGQGIYSHKDKSVIQAVVNSYEGLLLRDYAKNIDPSCFITILNTSQIIGKGFHYVN